MATPAPRRKAPHILSEVPEGSDDFSKGETAEDRQQLEANNMIYQVIRDHKQREHEKQMSVLRDAQSITETMMQKRREADENKSVVTASFSYANNLRYVSINSGGDPRILLGKGMHPLNPDECDVYTSLVDASENVSISASMNHHITEGGEIEGFRFTCSGSDVSSVLPISRRMFFGTSMVECSGKSTKQASDDESCDTSDSEDSRGTLLDPECTGSTTGTVVSSSSAAARIRHIHREASELESFMNNYNSSTGSVGLTGTSQSRNKIGLATAAILSSRGIGSQSSATSMMHFGRPIKHCRGAGRESMTILKLLLNQKEVKSRLVRLVQSIYRDSCGKEAGFHCMPDNSDILMGASTGAHEQLGQSDVLRGSDRLDPMTLFGSMHNRRAADSQQWKPEMPEMVGLYHAYVRGFNKDTRTHKLFIITKGGCTSMADSYFNLFVDVRNHMKVQDIANSEENWFLRNACRRNNARILLAVAKEFNLEIPTVTDTYDCDRGLMASCTTETTHYDIAKENNDRYSLCSMSVDPTKTRNGILFSMHPSEGVWLFKGPIQTSSAMQVYGGSFGAASKGHAFPVSSARVHDAYSWKSKSIGGSPVCQGIPCIVSSKASPCVANVATNGAVLCKTSSGSKGPCVESHTYVDEAYITSIQEDCHWSRDNGIIELIPIAVVEISDNY